MKILLTGGCGYVGSHTAMLASNQGHQVHVIDNLSRGHREFGKWGPLHEIDLRDSQEVSKFFDLHHFDAVIHFAAFAYVGESEEKPIEYWDNNVQGTINLLRGMSSSGVHNLVFSSTCAVYGVPDKLPLTENHALKPINPYGNTKSACERLIQDACKSSDLRAIRLRYFNACGAAPDQGLFEWHDPETHLIPLAIKAALNGHDQLSIFGEDFPTRDGTAIRDYVHVLDLAHAHLLSLEYLAKGNPSDVFNLGAGKGYSVSEVLTEVESVTDRKVPSRASVRRKGDPPELYASIEKATKLLGWQPRFDLKDAIRDAYMSAIKFKRQREVLDASDS